MSIRKFNRQPRCWCKVVGVWDLFKHHMYSNLFVRWWNNRLYYDTRLIKVGYTFTDARLQSESTVYVRNLIEAIHHQHIISPDRLSKSIEW